MLWISTIPIPDVVVYDVSVDNPITHEYALLSRARGATLSEIYQSSDDQQICEII